MSADSTSATTTSTTTNNNNNTTSTANTSTTDNNTIPPSAQAASQNAVKEALKANGLDQTNGDDSEKKDSSELVTVFNDREHFNAVHPLGSSWTLWFDSASKQDKAKSWKEQLQQVMKIKSVEEFWGLYNNIVPPSHIQVSSNYYLFRDDIVPAWEDEANAQGGKWSVQVPREKSKDQVDIWWLYTMLAAIGEIFETPYQKTNDDDPLPSTLGEEVTGVIISSRKVFYRISIWTRTADSRDRIADIGRHLKYNILQLQNAPKKAGGNDKAKNLIDTEVQFESHKDSQQKGNKNIFTV